MSNEELIKFISSVSGETHLKIEDELGEGFVRLRISEAQRRQAKHDIRSVEDIVVEMLRNARDARATKIFLATTRDESTRTLTVIDNGNGIPITMQDLIFEPRVTSKLETMVMDKWGVHGRGMALYSIKENARVARVATSQKDKGSSFFIDVDLEKLPEKTNQSTYPCLVRDEDGKQYVGRGPHNIARNLLEFAFEHRDIDVYYGSVSEIVSTLRYLGHKSLSDSDLLFCDDVETLPVCARPAACADALELTRICDHMGLELSQRTAHRILADEIKPLRPALNRLLSKSSHETSDEVDLYKDRRGLKISKDDIESFSRSLENAFEQIANSYYLALRDAPKITVTKDSIRVRFDIEKDI